MSDDLYWRAVDGGIEIRVRVVPGARKSQVMGSSGGVLRIRVAAPPVEGQANAELCRFVAKWCGVRASAVQVVAGGTSRDKRLVVRGVDSLPGVPDGQD